MKRVHLVRLRGEDTIFAVHEVRAHDWDGKTPIFIDALLPGLVEPAKGDEYGRRNGTFYEGHWHGT